MCAVLCTLDTLEDLIIYTQNKKKFLTKKFGIETIPSKATFAKILSLTDEKLAEDAILDILRSRFGTVGDGIVVACK